MDEQPEVTFGAPVGVEGVLAMAAADETFAQALVEQRQEALEASGVELAPADRAVLSAASPGALKQLVGSLDQALLSVQRRVVLGRLAAAAVAALTAGVAGCSRKTEQDKYKDPLAGGPSPRPRPMKRPASEAMAQKRPANPFDFKSKPLANPKNDSPFQKGLDGMGRPMAREPGMGKPGMGKPGKSRGPVFGPWGDSTADRSDYAVTGVRPDRPAPRRGSRPVVLMGRNTVRGPMDVAKARRVLRSRVYRVRSCYEMLAVKSNPKLKGTITATLVVGANGQVSYVRATSTLAHAETVKCVKRALGSLVFPKHSTTSTITVPFICKLK